MASSPETILYNLTDGNLVDAVKIQAMPRRTVYRWIVGAVAVQQREKAKRDMDELEDGAAHLGD